MNYSIEFNNDIKRCPNCLNSEDQAKIINLNNSYTIINDVHVLIEKPQKHYLMECSLCNIVYKSHFPDFETESILTNIWKKHSETRYQNSPSKRLTKITDFIKNLSITQKKPIKVLDIGVGEGSYLKLLSSEDNIDLYMMDCDREVLEDLKKKINANTVLADIGSLKDIEHLKGTFDVITAFDLIEHIPSSIFLENIYYMLKPGGQFLAETGNKDNLFCKIFGFQNWWYLSILEHKVFWSKPSLLKALKAIGYNEVLISKVIHKDRRENVLLKDAVKSIIWIIKALLLRRDLDRLRNPKFPIKDQLYIEATK